MTTILYYYYFIALFLVVLHAYIDADEIKRNKTINHKVEFFFFSFVVLLSIIMFYQSWYPLSFLQWTIFCGITTLFLRVGFYDFSLNLFRGKKIDYTSSTTNSIIDQIEKLDFDFTFWHERFFYLISSIITGLLYQLF
jgi:hypothetical protein